MTAPKGTQYVYCLNYRDNSPSGIDKTIEDARTVYDILGETLYAFEIGNEMERWDGRYRDEDWSPQVYTDEYLMYVDLMIERGVFSASSMPLFQGGSLMGSGNASYNEPWNSETLLMENGLNRRGYIKAMSQHDVSRANPDSCQYPPQLNSSIVPRQQLRQHRRDRRTTPEPPEPHQHRQPRLPPPLPRAHSRPRRH